VKIPAVKVPHIRVRRPVLPSLLAGSAAPLALASAGTALLVFAFVLTVSRLPVVQPQPNGFAVVHVARDAAPRASRPDQAVRMFFDLASSQRFDDAAQLWTPRLRETAPPTQAIG